MSTRYSPEVRQRAVGLVFDHEHDHPSQWSAIRSVAEKIGCTAETLRNWVRQAERDNGRCAGPSTDERQRMKELERENHELRRANEILREASALSIRYTERLAEAGIEPSVGSRGDFYTPPWPRR